MCFSGYIASTVSLTPITVTNPPTFSVEPLSTEATTVLGLPFPEGWSVARIGSHTLCACGFHSQPAWPWMEKRESDSDESTSRQRLADYIASLGPVRVQLFSHWEEDPAPEPSGRLLAPTSWIAQHWDPLPDGWLVEVDESAPTPVHPWEDGPIPEKHTYP